jgi:predicted RNA-binding protein YlxR (DUF448 family)
MVRMRATPSGLVLGSGPGRGAWLCGAHPVACLDEAIRRRTIARALRRDPGNDEIERLRARLEDREVPASDLNEQAQQ